MGRPQLGSLIQAHVDAAVYAPAGRELARHLGVSPTQLATWRSGDLKRLPEVENLRRLAQVLGVSYRVVLQAALVDAGYLREDDSYGTATSDAGERRHNVTVLGDRGSGVGLQQRAARRERRDLDRFEEQMDAAGEEPQGAGSEDPA